MAYYMRLFQPVQALMGLYSSIATVEVSLARVHQLLDARPDVVEAADPVRLTNVRGAVELERVSVDLGRGAVLSSVSFSVAAGQTIALVGPSGIGKSTIADLMVRLLDPDEGVVRLDGIDLRRVALEDLRRQVVLVDQEPILLHASIEDNIRYGRPEASSDQVATAASAAGLDDVTSRFPDRLQTVVGERGAALSAGERQRVAIARAFLANAAVLVLDEPTAALDPASERQILAGCERAMRGRTTILITHHLALAAAADRVLVLSDGVIVEQGSVEELQEKGGVFAALFAGQGSAAKVVRSSAGL
jgi:ATP-binding cassette subfamily B protein